MKNRIYAEIGYNRKASEAAEKTFVVVWNPKKQEHWFVSVRGIQTYGIEAYGRFVEFETEQEKNDFWKYNHECRDFLKHGMVWIVKSPRVEFRRGQWCWKKD